MKKYQRIHDDPVVMHHGIFQKERTVMYGIALIMSGTIGAGVLGIPYVVSKVGITLGILFIVCLGILMTALNLLVGEIAMRTKQNFQLVGLARRYLGKAGEYLMAIIMYGTLFGVLLVYMIGVGVSLQALFGGSSELWSYTFFVIGTLLVLAGMRTVKTVELFLQLVILFIVLVIAVFSFDHIELHNFKYTHLAQFLLPYGVILFAFHGTTSVPETYSLFHKKKADFQQAIIWAGVLNTLVYCLFAFVVVGVTGTATTEIATIGLGEKIGQGALVMGNLFAILAMATSFVITGVALRDSLCWDLKLRKFTSTLLIVVIPLVMFVLGMRQFIMAIDLVGGILISFEVFLILAMYSRAKKIGDMPMGRFAFKSSFTIMALIALAVAIGMIYSVNNVIALLM
ncbi:hypothetical protein H6758_04740 [Candidatus Nomurabacteria bacterium]|nr:hypothetical protein [Candidatus Nomurabacteria bacterium]